MKKGNNLSVLDPNTGRYLFITDEGKKAVGRYVNWYRENLPNEMRLEDFRDSIIEKTGYEKCSVSTLSKFENGDMRHDANLVAAIAFTLQMPHPFEGRNYLASDLDEAARMNLDLNTGLPYPKKSK